VGTRCADHVTPLYPQKLALTSPAGGGRSVGIVRVRTKATELVFFIYSFGTMHRYCCRPVHCTKSVYTVKSVPENERGFRQKHVQHFQIDQ